MTNQTLQPHLDWLNEIADDNYSQPRLIQSLWSGYGACFRALNTSTNQAVVVKCIQPENTTTHPKGWQSSHSHQRKLHSFAVEHYFYKSLQSRTSPNCKVPAYITGAQRDDSRLIVMEDLTALGFSRLEDTLSIKQSECVLRWLAEFHARFFSLNDQEVWQEGTYWHLATRMDEWQAMPESPLKDNAQAIATTLNSATYQTLLHGDGKVANFCFTPSMSACAAVDFQYCGMGAGIKDVAYFIGSALSEADQRNATASCLDVYFNALSHALAQWQPHIMPEAVEKEWRELYNVACADFYRFLAGWSPEHWKINQPLQKATEAALKKMPWR